MREIPADSSTTRPAAFRHDVAVYLTAVAMIVLYAVMAVMVFVVTHDPDLQNDEYKVSLWYIVQSFVFYFLCSYVYTAWYSGKSAWRLWAALLPFRLSGVIGIFWAINYVCILVAGSYLPNAIQAIFSQCQTIIVYLVNARIFGSPMHWWHHTIIGAIIAVNLATIWDGFEPDGQQVTGLLLVLLSLVFMCNALAAGFANNLLEAFFVAAQRDPSNGRAVYRGGYSVKDYVLAINAVAGLWSLVGGLALAFIPWITYQDDYVSRIFLDWSSFTNRRAQVYILIMGISSWLYTILSYWVLAEVNALWMTVTGNTATILSLVALSLPAAGDYQSVPNVTGWANNGLMCLISALYGYGQPKKDNARILSSRIGRYYQDGFARATSLEHDDEALQPFTAAEST